LAVHFVADLHLDPAQPVLADAFHRYLAGPARSADALYILGDLFEVWLGDDISIPRHRSTVAALSDLAATGVTLYFQRGNRDFAVGNAFARLTGVCVLDDPAIIDLFDTRTLLSHGDMLCTDDIEHLEFRRRYTDPAWRERMLALPKLVRRLLGYWARHKSRRGKRRKPESIMDVNPEAVRRAMTEHRADRLIHGHTHRPAIHAVELGGRRGERIVIPDWRPEQMEYLVCDEDGCRRVPIV